MVLLDVHHEVLLREDLTSRLRILALLAGHREHVGAGELVQHHEAGQRGGGGPQEVGAGHAMPFRLLGTFLGDQPLGQ